MGKGPAVLALVNISTPWSEADPGMPFQEWLRSVTGGTWPRALPEEDPAAWGSQQEEWVCAMSGRSGVSGLLKPNKALHEDARVDPQPSGGDTVKVVLRPVHCTDVDQLPEKGRRGRSCFAIISTPGGMVKNVVSRMDRERSLPHDMIDQFNDRQDNSKLR